MQQDDRNRLCSLPLINPVPAYITHNATCLTTFPSEILRCCLQSSDLIDRCGTAPSGATKGFIYIYILFFGLCSDTCKQTLMYKIVGSFPLTQSACHMAASGGCTKSSQLEKMFENTVPKINLAYFQYLHFSNLSSWLHCSAWISTWGWWSSQAESEQTISADWLKRVSCCLCNLKTLTLGHRCETPRWPGNRWW